jgi:hypothetical protein
MACRVMCAAGPSMARHSLEMKPSSSSAVQVEMASRAGGALMPMHLADPPCSLAFVYGTLKQGFSNHWLIEDVVGEGHAHFIGVAKTKQRFPLVCGPFQVPFLLHMPNSGLQVKGELYAVSKQACSPPSCSVLRCRLLVAHKFAILRLTKLRWRCWTSWKGPPRGTTCGGRWCSPGCSPWRPTAPRAAKPSPRPTSRTRHCSAACRARRTSRPTPREKRRTTCTGKTGPRTGRFWSTSTTGSTRTVPCPTSVCKFAQHCGPFCTDFELHWLVVLYSSCSRFEAFTPLGFNPGLNFIFSSVCRTVTRNGRVGAH